MSDDPQPQPGILAEVPAHARFLTFQRRPSGPMPREALAGLAEAAADAGTVVGIGLSLVRECGAEIPGLRTLPAMDGPGFSIPSTPAALWVWLRADEPGPLVHRTRELADRLGEAFRLESAVSAFRYGTGLDLTGYEDGTENPVSEAARAAAVVSGAGAGLHGSSFVAVQQWVHDFDRFSSFAPEVRDRIIGRRRSDNEELRDGSDAAHVKRTEQEAPDPPAFLLRRSMPWADGERAGLVFVAFGRSLAPFSYHLDRMTGAEDGIVDHLFRFTRPSTGAFFWCPPVADGRLDLSRLG